MIVSSILLGGPVSGEIDFSPVRKLMDEAVANGEVAGGSVLVLHQGEVVFEEGFGFADIESGTLFKPDTPVVVASISKPLLGTAAFRVAERSRIKLTTPVSRYLPEFNDRKLESGKPVERAPTMMELLTHTAGMRPDDSPGGRPWFSSWSRGQSLEFVVGKIANEFPFSANPGKKFGYSGSGTEVVARVLEVRTGKPRNVLFVEELARPLGMSRTFYRDAESVKKAGKMPTRYYIGKEGGLRESRKRYLPERNGYGSSGGAVISTAPDLAKWLVMLRNEGKHGDGQFLPPGTVAKMLEKSEVGSSALGGLFVRRCDEEGKPVRYGHTGSSGTNCWIDFEKDVIGIMLTQTAGKQIKSFRKSLERVIDECVSEITE